MAIPKVKALPTTVEEEKGTKEQDRKQKDVDDSRRFKESYPCYMCYNPKQQACLECKVRGTCMARTKMSGNDVFYR